MQFKKKLYILLALAICIAPLLGVYPIFILKLLCFGLFACAFNILIGFSGLVSFGHAAFFGGAGYVCGYVIKVFGLTPEFGIIFGVLFAAILGYLMGSLSIRREGIYFSMITMATSQLVYFFFLQAKWTGGEDGLQSVPRGKLLGMIDLTDDRVLFYFVILVLAFAYWFITRIIHSPFGQILLAIRESESRATSLGYDTYKFKLTAFIISAALAGLAGALKVLVMGFETLTDVHWTMSGLVILMTLVGGLGTFIGPLVGAIIIVSLENKLGDIGIFLANATGVDAFMLFGESVTTVTGLIFIMCVLMFRRGVMGELIYRTAPK